jgi:kynureninase
LLARGIVIDFRPPDIIRFGIKPLYTKYEELWDAVCHLKEILVTGEFEEDRFDRVSHVP